MQLTAYRTRAFETVPASLLGFSIVRENLRRRGRWAMSSLKETNEGPTSLLERLHPTECGIVFPPGGGWRQSFHSTRRSDDLPGSAGKRHTRGRKAGELSQMCMELEGREMRKPSLILNAMGWISGKPSALKGARSVWERGVRNVLTTRVRERGLSVSITLASPFGDEVTR